LEAPTALLGVMGKGSIVDLQPSWFVVSDAESSHVELRMRVNEGERSAHLMQDSSRCQSDESGHFDMADRRLEDPPVQVAATTLSDFSDGRIQHFRSDQAHFVTVMGMNDEFERERVMAFADLGICDWMIVARFPSDEAGKTLASSIDEIEPKVIGERPVSIRSLGGSDQIAHDREIIGLHLAFDVENVHAVTLPLRSWSIPRDGRRRASLLVV
ncbi:MAG: hypothetical protein RLZ37_241, partial [Actinomycetota bacterium]